MKALTTAILLTICTLTFATSQDSIFAAVYQAVEKDLGLDTMPASIRIQDAFFSQVIDVNDNPAAATQKLHKNAYLINIYFTLDEARLVKALIHELVHVSQMQSGRMLVERKQITFDGQAYTKSTPYNERPFEAEAIALADELYNKYFSL